MGAWGNGSRENDAAADLLCGLDSNPVEKVVADGLESEDYNEQIAAADLLLERVYPPKLFAIHLTKAEKALVKILADNEWLSKWINIENKKKIINDLLTDIRKVKR